MKYLYIVSMLLLHCTSCSFSTKRLLKQTRKEQPIIVQELNKGFDKNVMRAFYDNGVEYGIITFPNKDTVNYWFLSHHIAAYGSGGTLFEYPKNKLTFIKGYFCCEVQLPQNGNFENANEFLNTMKELDGINP